MNDLEWLARNVHEWPKNGTYAVVNKSGGPEILWDCGTEYGESFFERQWQAERARLQNKPKWEEFPQAKIRVQNGNGIWCVGTYELARVEDQQWSGNGEGYWITLTHTSKHRGEVLGDWRDTLERRPVSDMPPIHENMRCVMSSDIEKIEPDWTKAPDGTTHYSDRGYMRWYKCENGGVCGYSDNRWVPLPLDVFSEKDKEALMEKPKEWRGPEDGLPPVGAELRSNGGDCVVMAVQDEEHVCVQWIDGELGIIDAGYLRPRQSEEDRAVEDMINIIAEAFSKSGGEWAENEDIARAIYAAGYRKQEPSE